MLKFPFDKYRKNQRELAVCVYKTIASKKRLFVEAPTGTGKTVSVLFPALKAMGEEKCSRILTSLPNKARASPARTQSR